MSSANKTPTPSLSTRISKKITGKSVTIVSRIKQEAIKTVTAEPESINTNPAVILPPSPTLIEVHIQFESAMDKGGVVTTSDTAGYPPHRPGIPQSAHIIEKLPVSMTTTTSDVIKRLVEKHGGMVGTETREDLELYYLKQCTDSDGGEYRRVMDGEENITECLEKQENGSGKGTAGVFFHLCKQKPVNNKETNTNSSSMDTKPSTTNNTLQHESETNIVDAGSMQEPYFFSPPHVSHVSDRNYRRRNSLPSYFTSTSNTWQQTTNGQATISTDSSKLSPTIRGSRTNKLQSLSEIMNQVIKETPQPLSAHSPPRRRQSSSDQSSPCRVRHLISSPFVSPEKLYPKFVYTPGPGANDKGSSAVQSSLFSDPVSPVPAVSSPISPDPNVSSPISPDPAATSIVPPVYSLDTSRETHHRDATSSASPSLNDDPQCDPGKDEQCSMSCNNGDDKHGGNETVESNNLETLSVESNPPSEGWNETQDKLYETESCDGSQIDSMIEGTPVSKHRSISNSTSSTSTISGSSLVSPARTSSLLDEATTHVLRRRSSEYIRSKAVSESDLGRPCLLFNKPPKSEMSRQTSSPGLISVARHDMLLRRASQRVRDAREKRRSLLLETSEIKDILPAKESAKLPKQESDRSTDSIRDAELRESTGIQSSGTESASFTGTSIQNTGTTIHSKLMPST